MGQAFDSSRSNQTVIPPIVTPQILDTAKAIQNGTWIERIKFLVVDNKSRAALVLLKQQGELVKSKHDREIDSLKSALKALKDSKNTNGVADLSDGSSDGEILESNVVEEKDAKVEKGMSPGLIPLLSVIIVALASISLVFLNYKRLKRIRYQSQKSKKQHALLKEKIDLQPVLEENISNLSNDIDRAMELTSAETEFMAQIINDKNNPNIKSAKEIVSGTQILKRMVSELPHSKSSGLRKTNVNRLIEEVSVQAYYSMRDHFPDFSCEMRRDLEKILPDTELNADDIRFVLFNILENAFESVWLKKSNSGKGYQPSVTITSRKLPRYIQVRVKDNGMGISDNVRKQIFTPFFTDKPDSNHIGLGLFESYDLIVNKYKGDLILENDFQSSTDFIIRLPLKS
ncbi:MAG: sensor histidine kinase [Bacteroidota bacterium]